MALRRGERTQARLGEGVKGVPHSCGNPPHGFCALPHTLRWSVQSIARIDDSHGGQANALWARWEWPDSYAKGPATPSPGGRAPAPSRRSPSVRHFALCQRFDDCSCYFGLFCSGCPLAEGTRVPHYAIPKTARQTTRFTARHRRFENLRNGFQVHGQNRSVPFPSVLSGETRLCAGRGGNIFFTSSPVKSSVEVASRLLPLAFYGCI